MPGSELDEVADDFFSLEKELGLLNIKLDDVYFWERIRTSVFQNITADLNGSDSVDTESGEGYRDHLSGAWLLFKNLFVRNPFLPKGSDLLFYGTGRRKKMENGIWRDIYIDPIVDELNKGTVVLERPFNVSHRTPAETPGLRYVDIIEYTGTVLQKTGIVEVSISEEKLSQIDEIKSRIRSDFGVDVPLRSMVEEDLSLRKARLPLYRRLVRRIDPEVALLTVSYCGRETFVEACQAEGVPVVELQHGVINRYHMAYSFPYEDKNVFPDYFFSFGEFWSDSTDLPLPDENVYPVGYPHLQRMSEEYVDVEKKQKTLFISQPGTGDRLSDVAIELNKADGYDGEVVYKLHPKEHDVAEDRYPHLTDSDVTVVSDDPPLYRIFAESKAQVGVSSTALYEGLNFGLETYVFQLLGSEYMRYLLDNGYATEVTSTNDLVSELSAAVSDSYVQSEYFFEPNPVENFQDGLDDVLRDYY